MLEPLWMVSHGEILREIQTSNFTTSNYDQQHFFSPPLHFHCAALQLCHAHPILSPSLATEAHYNICIMTTVFFPLFKACKK